MTEQEKISEFNRGNRPFMLAKLGSRYGLNLNFSSHIGRYRQYGQEAFDRYSIENGEPVMTEDGIRRHGNGYEWEMVFKAAFVHDSRIQEINFDCEARGFYCDAGDLDLMIEFGSRFRKLCEGAEQFSQLVSKALSEKARQDKYDIEHQTLRFHLRDCSRCSLEIETPSRHLYIGGGKLRKLLKGIDIEVYDMITETACQIPAKDLLELWIEEREDDREYFTVRMKSSHEIGEHHEQKMAL